jgi:formate dehydrogenase subunit beta
MAMYVYRALQVDQHQTSQAVAGFLGRLLDARHIDRLLIPVPVAGRAACEPRLIHASAQVMGVDVLRPVQAVDMAGTLARMMHAEPEARFGAFLRPCELRTVVELVKRERVDGQRLLAICADCAGTYTADVFQQIQSVPDREPEWSAGPIPCLAELGLPAPEGARLACELCDRPAPDYATANIVLGLIGVRNTERVLVVADEGADARLHLDALTDGNATEREAVEREMTLWTMVERRRECAEARLESLGLKRPTLAAITGYFEHCTLCGECLRTCALCSEGLADALHEGKAAFVAALLTEGLRLASCSGCGVCQLQCPEGIPLAAIGHVLGRGLQERIAYVPGRSVEEPLPWVQ